MAHHERVVLLDDAGCAIGVADKATVHHADTPLHLAFSCHLVDHLGRTLVTRRALEKRTWPGVWTNSFCGHPAPGESIEEAIHRRAHDELGIQLTELQAVLPDFRYRAVDASGVVENEVCPVYLARAVGDPHPSAEEVAEWRWVSSDSLRDAAALTPWAFSPWLVEQLRQLSEAGAA